MWIIWLRALGLKVVNFHIRREYRYHPPHFKDYIIEQIKNILDLRQQVLAGKQWQYLKRLLLVLTAAEQAEVKNLELRTGRVDASLESQGIALEVLASWLGEAAVNSAQLVFALYSLKELREDAA